MDNTVNERVRSLRKSLGMSQQAFAEKVSMSTLAISRIETGASNPRPSNIARIAEAFSVDRDWLVNGEGSMTYSQPKDSSTAPDEATEAWKSKAEHLEKEVVFYRELLLNLTGKVNFHKPSDLIGFSTGKVVRSVRVAA